MVSLVLTVNCLNFFFSKCFFEVQNDLFERKFTSSVNSTTGVLAVVGVDEVIEIGSFSIGGVDEIGVNADV